MRHGLSLFPVLAPEERSAADWYADSLALTQLAEAVGLDHVRIAEHHLGSYGGYSPDPTTFLAAAAVRTTRLRLTAAVLPESAHPVQLAGKLAMLDTLSGGRLGVCFGQASRPGELAMFGIDLDPGGDRFAASVTACRRLWSGSDVVVDDGFHRFGPITSFPRTLQAPHPPIAVASSNPTVCAWAGREGFGVQLTPATMPPGLVQDLVAAYRGAWVDAGRDPVDAEVQLGLTCYLDANRERALGTAETLERDRVAKMAGTLPDYDFAASHRDGAVLAGRPGDVVEQLERIRDRLGDVDVSCVLGPGYLSPERAAATVRSYAERVVPALQPTLIEA